MHRKTTKELLADSFRELAREKSFDKITVREIAENGGYSQATFYRQFKDKYDLIAWDYARGVEKIMDRIGNDYPWRQTLVDGAVSFQTHRGYLTNLLRHTGGHDSFVRYMTETNYNALRQYVMDNNGTDDLDERTDMYIRIYVLGTVNLTCEWILERYTASPEELADIYVNSLPSPLRPILLE